MKVDVQTLSENCRKCPRLEIIVNKWWSADNVYEVEIKCEHLDDCLVIAEMIGEKK